MNEAVAAWVALLEPNSVILDRAELSLAATATYPVSRDVCAILLPSCIQQVAECLRIANRYQVPLHAVSRGRNWGLGSRAPAKAGAAILDLRYLSEIREYCGELGFITVEPGVTFDQVNRFLRDRRSEFFLPTIGGPPDASVVGNAIQRGHGIGPAPRRMDAVGSVELILPDGTVTDIGFAAGAAFRGAEARSEALGPVSSALCAEGVVGIVTAMTLRLERRPRHLTPFLIHIGGHEPLGAFFDRWRDATFDQYLGRFTCNIWNQAKIVAVRSGSLKIDSIDSIGREPVGDWYCSGALYAPAADMAEVQCDHLTRIASDCQELSIFDTQSIDPNVDEGSPFLGTPFTDNLASMYAAKSFVKMPPEPERDNCGFIHFCPLLPMSSVASDMLKFIGDYVADRGFVPQIGFDGVDPRFIEAYVSIAYDRDDPAMDRRIAELEPALSREIQERGYPLYRLGIHVDDPFQYIASGKELTNRIRHALDPHAIVSSPYAPRGPHNLA